MSAIYEVVLRSTFQSKSCINVWHYVENTPLAVPTALQLLQLMGFIPLGDPPELPATGLFADIRALVSNTMSFVEVSAQEMYSLTDFYLAGFSPVVPGEFAGVATTPVLAYALQSNRVRTDIRRGMKRIAGVTEEGMTTGGYTTGTPSALLDSLAVNMSASLTEVGVAYRPAIVSLERKTKPDGTVYYEKYATRDEQLEHTAFPVSWSAYPMVRTQGTRQYGRGT